MAKSLQERLASARDSDRTTIETLAALITDCRAERDRLVAAHERASADSIDFALDEADREEAAANAGRYARSLAALATALAEIEAKLDAKRNSDAQRAKEAEKRAAITERDEIATRFAKRVPAITAEMIELFKAVAANEHRMRAAGVHEANAEFKARGIPGNGLVGVSPAMPFVKMKIPDFHGAGRAWPVDTLSPMATAIAEADYRRIVQGRKDAEREAREKAEAAERFARENGVYEITVEGGVGMNETVARIPDDLVYGSVPAALGPWDRKELVLSHEHAKALAKVPRLQVKCLAASAAQ